MMEGPSLICRRELVAALLTPPTVTLLLLPSTQRTKTQHVSFLSPPLDLHDDDGEGMRTCHLCLCQERWKNDDDEWPLTYDMDLVRETLKREMAACSLDLEEDLTFCPFCSTQLQGLVRLRRQMGRLEQRLKSMTTGLMTLLSSTLPEGDEDEEEDLVILKEEVEDQEEIQDLHVPNTEDEDTTPEFKFRCPVCSKAFQKASKLQRHSVVHTKDKPFSCPLCPLTFTQASSVKTHVSKVHFRPHDSSWLCSLCDKSFQHRAQLQRHAKACKVIKRRVTCHSCPRSFSDPRYLQQHVKFIHTRRRRQPTRRRRPAVCLEESRSTDSEEEEETTRTPSTTTPPSPTEGGEEEERLVVVKEEVEDAEAMYILTCATDGQDEDTTRDEEECQGLELDVTTEADLTKATPAESKKKSFSCPVCSKTFQKPSKLKGHSVVHTKDKPFPCPLCPVTFTQGSRVKIHVAKVHKVCSLCDTSFQDATQAERHVRTCSVRVPCPYCPRSFGHPSRLDQHVKFLHSHSRLVHGKGNDGGRRRPPAGPPMEECHPSPDIGPDLPPQEGSNKEPDFKFPCSYCGKLFGHRWNRDRHALAHTSKKPSYRCSICSMRFARRDGLGRHLKNVHPDEDEEEGTE